VSSVRVKRKEALLNFPVDDNCPRCGKPIRLAVIEIHPIRSDAAIRSLTCTHCDHVKITVLSLRTDNPPPKLAAETIKE
jgi:hypothetical protein